MDDDDWENATVTIDNKGKSGDDEENVKIPSSSKPVCLFFIVPFLFPFLSSN